MFHGRGGNSACICVRCGISHPAIVGRVIVSKIDLFYSLDENLY